ncbi:MAG: Ig-like domain-containing protein [Cyclobacteriaceae bacterium]
MTRNYALTSLLCLTGLWAVQGCTDSDEEPTSLDRMEITMTDNDMVAIGDTKPLDVKGYDKEGNEVILSSIEWTAGNGNLSVDANGTVTGLQEGNTEVKATTEGVETAATLRVRSDSSSVIEIYVSDAASFNTGPYKIMRYEASADYPTEFITERLSWPQDILFLEEQGIVLVSNLSSGQINAHDIITGRYLRTFAGGIGGPTRMKIGPDGLLYVLQWEGNGRVRRYNLDGTQAGTFTSTGVSQSIGMDWDAEGNLYVSSFGDKTVTKFDTNGDEVSELITSNLQGPTNLWIDESGDVLVLDWTAGLVRRFGSDGTYKGVFISGLSKPEGVDFFGGSIFIGNGGTGAVKRFGGNGFYTEDVVPAGTGGLQTPNAVVVRKVEL